MSTAITTTAAAAAQGSPLYNERGDQVGVSSAIGASNAIAAETLGAGYLWYDVPQLLGDFQGIIRTLVSLMVILVVAGFLAQAGVGLTQYGMGKTAGGLASAVGGAVMSLVVSIVVMYLTPSPSTRCWTPAPSPRRASTRSTRSSRESSGSCSP